MEDINLLLSYLETEVLNGKKPFMGSGVIVDGETTLGLIKRIRQVLPYVTGEAILEDAKQKAAEMLDYAENKRAQLLDEHILISEAKAISEHTVKEALKRKELIENKANENIIAMLTEVKSSLSEAGQRVNATIEKINSVKE